VKEAQKDIKEKEENVDEIKRDRGNATGNKKDRYKER
jgi:hypothetical protein